MFPMLARFHAAIMLFIAGASLLLFWLGTDRSVDDALVAGAMAVAAGVLAALLWRLAGIE